MLKCTKKAISVLLCLALCIGIIPSLSVFAAAGESLPYYFEDFEDKDPEVAKGSDYGAVSIETPGAGGSEGCLKFVAANQPITGGQPQISPDFTINCNLGTVPQDGKIRLSFMLKLGKKLNANNVIAVMHDGTGYMYFDPVSGKTFDNTSTEWQQVVLQTEVKKGVAFKSIQIRFGNYGMAYNATTDAENGYTGERIYYLDDVSMQVISPGAIPPVLNKTNMSLENYYVDFEENGTTGYLGGYGLAVASTTARDKGQYSYQVVADPDNSSNRVMRWTYTDSGQGNDALMICKNGTGTSACPSITMENGETLHFTFKIRNTEVLTAGNIAIKLSGEKWINATFDPTNTTDWQTVSLSFTNNTGAKYKSTWFELRFGSSSNVYNYAKNLETGETKYGKRTVYIDDFKAWVEDPAEVYPTVENFKITGDAYINEAVVFDYDFTPANQTGTDECFIKLMVTDDQGVTATAASGSANEPFVIPDNLAGKTITFEIIPIDSDGYVGAPQYVSTEVYKRFEILFDLSDFAGNSVTADVSIENYKVDGSSINSMLIVAIFDAQGGLVKIGSKNVVCPNGNKVTDKLTVTADNAKLPAAASAKAFLWNCNDTDEEQETLFNTKMTELAPDIEVIK